MDTINISILNLPCCELSGVSQSLYPPRTSECDLVCKRVFEGAIKVRITMMLYWSRVGPKFDRFVFSYRKGHRINKREEQTNKEVMIGALYLPGKDY